MSGVFSNSANKDGCPRRRHQQSLPLQAAGNALAIAVQRSQKGRKRTPPEGWVTWQQAGETRKKRMDRRSFLAKSAAFLMDGVFGSRIPVSAENFSPVAHPPRIALIIDDIGFNLKRAELFLKADIPITFSVLPRVCWSVESALALHARGHEIMHHQPMEPFDTEVAPGPGAIFVNDRPECIHQMVAENIATQPHVIGVNNHMGSRYTQQPQKMGQALDVVRNCGLFFVDSLTTGHSSAYDCTRQMGVSSKRRDLFLDNHPEISSVIRQMKRLRIRAQKQGSAIGIGHPRPDTAEGIMRFLETPESRDVAFVYISQLF